MPNVSICVVSLIGKGFFLDVCARKNLFKYPKFGYNGINSSYKLDNSEYNANNSEYNFNNGKSDINIL